MKIGRALLQYGDVSYAMVILAAVKWVWNKHGEAICAFGALHWGKSVLASLTSVDACAIAEA